jgi:hypothetical protein
MCAPPTSPPTSPPCLCAPPPPLCSTSVYMRGVEGQKRGVRGWPTCPCTCWTGSPHWCINRGRGKGWGGGRVLRSLSHAREWGQWRGERGGGGVPVVRCPASPDCAQRRGVAGTPATCGNQGAPTGCAEERGHAEGACREGSTLCLCARVPPSPSCAHGGGVRTQTGRGGGVRT